MIVSCGDDDREELFREEPNRRFSQIARVDLRRLIAVDAAEQVPDLAVPPGNRLEPLKGRARRPALDPDQRPVAHCLPLDRTGPPVSRSRTTMDGSR